MRINILENGSSLTRWRHVSAVPRVGDHVHVGTRELLVEKVVWWSAEEIVLHVMDEEAERHRLTEAWEEQARMDREDLEEEAYGQR